MNETAIWVVYNNTYKYHRCSIVNVLSIIYSFINVSLESYKKQLCTYFESYRLITFVMELPGIRYLTYAEAIAVFLWYAKGRRKLTYD